MAPATRSRWKGEAGLPSVEASWSVDYTGDDARLRTNHAVLDGVAPILSQYKELHLDVHSETGEAAWASEALARHYKLRQREDVQTLMDHLARNRAAACVAALVKRGVDEARLVVSYRGRSGRLGTHFRPRAGPFMLDELCSMLKEGNLLAGLELISFHDFRRGNLRLGSYEVWIFIVIESKWCMIC